MQKLIAWFFSGFLLPVQSTWFKRLLYLFVLFKCAYWLAYYDILFGKNSIIYSQWIDIGPIKSLAFLLYQQDNVNAAYWFLIPAIVIALLNVFKVTIPFLADLVLWFFIINLNNKVYSTLTGGDLLLNNLLFFNCFVSYKFSASDRVISQIRLAAHNFGIIAIVMQICAVYFFSALAKWQDPLWVNGTAVLSISKVQHYSLPWIAQHADSMHTLLVLLNYIVLFYQSLFPLLVWVKRIKVPFLLIGILMHLYIIFAMGIVGFGIIMIFCYALFWPARLKDIKRQDHWSRSGGPVKKSEQTV